MRLLNTTSLTFKDFSELDSEPYTILSHCWYHGLDWQEPTYQQALNRDNLVDSVGWRKVTACCRIARSRGLKWAWIDTVCINKTSSAELGETVNCMYSWYQRSAECYVFLEDVPVENDADFRRPTFNHESIRHIEDFSLSRWFTRGWTLQELLAPSTVLFYDRFGSFIGTRSQLATNISSATGIDPQYLTQRRHIHDASIAQRMSWASRRTTTRPEDMAYSLLGIFDVNIPLLYGEGSKSFQRLQLAIIEQSDDASVFAWGMNSLQEYNLPRSMLASSPMDFLGSESVTTLGSESVTTLTSAKLMYGSHFQATKNAIVFRYTDYGLEVLRTMFAWDAEDVVHLRLACKVTIEPFQAYQLSIKLRRDPYNGKYYRVGPEKVITHRASGLIDILCSIIANDKVVHVASHRRAVPLAAFKSNQPQVFGRINLSLRQSLMWYLRFIWCSVLVVFSVTSGNDVMLVGALIMIRDLATRRTFAFWFVFMTSLLAFSGRSMFENPQPPGNDTERK